MPNTAELARLAARDEREADLQHLDCPEWLVLEELTVGSE